MNASLLVAKSEIQKERSLARIISIQFTPAEKVKKQTKIPIREETGLFYTKPIFRARKYELF